MMGHGTGIAARQTAERGVDVLGVELAPGVAEIARRYGIAVEIAAFEDWDVAGRTFARAISAQAWHWLDVRGSPIAVVTALAGWPCPALGVSAPRRQPLEVLACNPALGSHQPRFLNGY